MADEDVVATDEEEDGYLWLTNGGCERCDSMEGRLFPEPPDRPHPHCNCTIEYVGRLPESCQSDEADITLQHEGNNHPHGGNPSDNDTFEMFFAYRVICPAGDVFEGEIMIERTYGYLYSKDTDDLFDEAYAEVYDRVEELATTECRPCPPGLGVS